MAVGDHKEKGNSLASTVVQMVMLGPRVRARDVDGGPESELEPELESEPESETETEQVWEWEVWEVCQWPCRCR